MKRLNLGADRGVAVREYPTHTGPADYVLFIDREPVGVIEAKPDNTILTFAEEQTARYAGSVLKWRVPGKPPLPFLFEATGQVIHFTDGRDPAPRSREVFHFFRPEHLAALESKTCMDAERVNPALFVQPGDFLFSRANTVELVGACVVVQQVKLRVMLSDQR